jgi:WS/DGAT/MGAT family acyltransferase
MNACIEEPFTGTEPLMTRLSLLDASFLMAENRETPMHVAGVHLYRYPKGANKREFLGKMREILLSSTDLRPPFNQRLADNVLSRANLAFSWENDRAIDMDYHVRHSALPKPGRYRELFTLVSRLHSTLLDRNRPLWEMHLIEGLAGNQFAIYLKTHHCMMDGVASMHMAHSVLSESSTEWNENSLFSRRMWERYMKSLPPRQSSVAIYARDHRSLVERIVRQVGGGKSLAGALLKYANVWVGGGKPLNVPWHGVPRGSISSSVSGSRRFVAQTWPYQRIRAVGKALNGTLNDAVLAMCAGALRNYLEQTGDLPARPLKAMVPVSLRVEGDIESANAVGFIVANLGTHLADAGERFETIQNSVRAGKEVYAGLSAGEAALFAQITASPMTLTTLFGLGDWLPAYNLVISNVPGPRKTMYWNGARLEGMYPASIVLHGQALNITLVSYADQIDFGIIACRRTMPSVQRLLDLLEGSLSDLETAAGLAR